MYVENDIDNIRIFAVPYKNKSLVENPFKPYGVRYMEHASHRP